MQVSPDLPCFLLGHSMGGMAVQTFLIANPSIAKRFTGIVFSAPFFGMANKLDAAKQWGVGRIYGAMGDFVLSPDLPVDKITRNKTYVRQVLTQHKAAPFFTLSLAASFLR
jgi:alpha-beta hydrolase superfamily lysophospholipase